MVNKIQPGEYGKRRDNMTPSELRVYSDRVGEWLRTAMGPLTDVAAMPEARLQSVAQQSIMWNDSDCRAFEEGAVLMTSVMNTCDTWLPDMLYVKSAARCIRHMAQVLAEVHKMNCGINVPTTAATPVKPAKEPVAPDANPQPAQVKTESPKTPEALPVRPKHIDQYVHLLPEKTQERASHVKELLRQMEESREKARLLSEDPKSNAADIARWASQITSCDNRLHSIYKELDLEWEKLVKSGRVTVDDLGNVHVSAETGTPAEKAEAPELTSEQKHRRRELRKWLIDLRRGGQGKARDKRIAQWKNYWKEYITLEPLEDALQDDKIVAAAKHFGITITDNR